MALKTVVVVNHNSKNTVLKIKGCDMFRSKRLDILDKKILSYIKCFYFSVSGFGFGEA